MPASENLHKSGHMQCNKSSHVAERSGLKPAASDQTIYNFHLDFRRGRRRG
jgi:hypothetical protein